MYGAERRGAAIAAFTRIDEVPIRERGVIVHPDLIVVGDETLLDDPAAAVLAGQESASAVFVNADAANEMAAKYAVQPRLIALDVTRETIETLGKAAALSAGLAAAAARLSGIVAESALQTAVREELAHLELPAEVIEQNLVVAGNIFRELEPVGLRRSEPPVEASLYALAFDGPLRGTPSILAAGNAVERHTGSWRVERPEIDYDRCTRCGICFVRCPDGAIALDEHGYPVIDYDHCKGCMICWDQCPVAGAVVKKREVRSW